jgi:predicted RNase H-like HicB family nuclease
MRYAVVIEKAENNCSAYVPDLPGCIATVATVGEAEQLIREAIELYLNGLRGRWLTSSAAVSRLEYLEYIELAA